MKKQKEAPPIIVSDRSTPTCKNSACDIVENPTHWVDVELTPDARIAVEEFRPLCEAVSAAIMHRDYSKLPDVFRRIAEKSRRFEERGKAG